MKNHAQQEVIAELFLIAYKDNIKMFYDAWSKITSIKSSYVQIADSQVLQE